MKTHWKETSTSKKIRVRYRESLLAIGQSPDVHIYDLRYDFISPRRHPKELRFLRKIKDFYFSLDFETRCLFLNECLERGRHYKFWYLSRYEDRTFFTALAKMQEKLEGLSL